MPIWFVQLSELKQFLRYFYKKTFQYMDIIWKTQNSVFVENYNMRGYNFYMTVTRNETAN